MAKKIEFDPTVEPAFGTLEDVNSLDRKHQEVQDGTKQPTLEELEHKRDQLENQRGTTSNVDLPVLEKRIEEINLKIKQIIEQVKKAA